MKEKDELDELKSKKRKGGREAPGTRRKKMSRTSAAKGGRKPPTRKHQESLQEAIDAEAAKEIRKTSKEDTTDEESIESVDKSQRKDEDDEEDDKDGDRNQDERSPDMTPTGQVADDTAVKGVTEQFVKDCQLRGHMASARNIKYKVKNLVKTEWFRKMKSYKMASSEEKKKDNEVNHKLLHDFFKERLNTPLPMESELWTSVQKYTTLALRSKRSSVTEAIKKLFTGK